MMITQCNPFEGEVHFFAPAGDFLLQTILESREVRVAVPRPAAVRMPVIKIPRSLKRTCSDSELSSAAMMLEKLKTRRDVINKLDDELPARMDQEKAVDVVVETLLELQS
jgi:hypothetical protein